MDLRSGVKLSTGSGHMSNVMSSTSLVTFNIDDFHGRNACCMLYSTTLRAYSLAMDQQLDVPTARP